MIAQEPASEALAGKDAARLDLAQDWREADTRALANVFNMTQRRAQQIKKRQALAVAAGQGVLL